MKKKLLIISLIFVCLALCACQPKNVEEVPIDFKPKDGQCVVSIPSQYSLAFGADGEQTPTLDAELANAQTIDGQPKDDHLQYFCVPKNQQFRIVTPPTVRQNKNSNNLTLKYWKLNGTSYEDCDGYLSKNVYTCTQNTSIEPVYCQFRTVGIILFLTNGQHSDEFFDEDGKTKEGIFDESGNIIFQDNVKYLYGAYDFNPNREKWTTNLEVQNFDVFATVEGCTDEKTYTIAVTVDLTKLLGKGTVVIKSLCQIDGHGFMIDPTAATQIIDVGNTAMSGTFYIPLGANTLQCTFTNNMQ